jgi:hypothetical protein
VITCGLVLAICAISAMAQNVSKPRSGIRKVPVVVQSGPIAPPAAIPKPPPPPPAPEKMPPEPPLVTYDGYHLTIVCDNSTLADILVAVRDQTGADIEIPANASRERIAARLGPAPARAVLTSLLGGTDFDYAIQAPDDDDQGIQTVLLTPRKKVTDPAIAGRYPRSEPFRRAARHPLPPDPATEESDPTEDIQQSAVSTPASSAEEPPPASQPDSGGSQPAPASTPSSAESLQAAATDPQPTPVISDSSVSQPQTRTEQMIGELQRMYQQRMQMQEQARKSLPTN